MSYIDLIRIGDKVLNPHRIHSMVDRILQLRHEGMSQQEVADRLEVDRTLISRLESLGEIRKGPQIALVGFPVANAQEITAVAQAEGVDYTIVLNDKERWNFVEEKSGAELFNQFMDLLTKIKCFDIVIFIGSDMRIKLMEALMGTRLIAWEIGTSPIKEDCWINPEHLKKLVRQLKSRE